MGMNVCELLIEIGVEELPAIPFLRELPNILPKWEKVLVEYKIPLEDVKFSLYYTPRRIVIYAKSFPTCTKEETQEFFGPPLTIAYKDNVPTNATIGFAKKCGVDIDQLQRTQKNNQEVLYAKKVLPKQECKKFLPTIVEKFIKSLNFGKAMRWGDGRENDYAEFIRPITSLAVLLGEESVSFKLFGITANPSTFVHRSKTFDKLSFKNATEYFNLLECNGVILDPQKRKQKILEEMQKIEKTHNVHIEVDESLLAEVIAITEYPTALFSNFDARFLELPPECIIISMKTNQRYFAVYRDSKLYNAFIVVSNALTQDFSLIIQGNLRVLVARLEDALFFYHNDIKSGFQVEKLAEVVFVNQLGSMLDKTHREEKIAQILGNKWLDFLEPIKERQKEAIETLLNATHLSKADLVTEMVYEFTELQGIMGYYYALQFGLQKDTALAIKEQYLPNSETSELPTNHYGAILALSYRLDNLMGLFSCGKIPTGSSDPFALRRAGIGILKIVLHFNLPFNLQEVLNSIKHLYTPFELGLLENFIWDRLEVVLPYNPSLIRAVLSAGERDICKVAKKLSALQNAIQSSDRATLAQTFKRLANITKEVTDYKNLPIEEELLVASEEIELFKSFSKIEQTTFSNYEEQINALIALKPLLDRFFDKVLVNVEDVALRNNRKYLIARIYKAFLNIADIKEISL